ncbi:putative DBINO protein [Hordeum vulgare]|nr:putative DBINO protein [Hordeum vulgare]
MKRPTTVLTTTMVTRGMETTTSIAKVMAMKMKSMTLILVAFQSLEAFKAQHDDKPFTLTHCWTIINDFPKFKDQYCELQRKRGKKTTKFVGGEDGEALKRPRGKTNSKVDDIQEAAKQGRANEAIPGASMEEARDGGGAKKRKIDLEEAARQRKLDMEAANVEARKRQLDIEATNAATKEKEVALAIMSMDLTKMSEKTRSWFEARQREMFDADDLN